MSAPDRPTGRRAPTDRPVAGRATSPEALAAWLAGRRWFAGPGADAATRHLLPLGAPPAPSIGLVDVVTAAGTDRYQTVVAADAPAPDVADDPVVAGALVAFATGQQATPASPWGAVRGRWLPGAPPPGTAPARPLGGEQSNTSVAVGGTHVLKLYRRLRPGPHPELEVGRHLAVVAGRGRSVPVAPLAGWLELSAPADPGEAPDPAAATALAVVQGLVSGALDGWTLALSALAGDPGGFLARLHELGTAVAHLHGALAEPADPSIDPPDDDGRFGVVALDRARIDEVAAAIDHDSRNLAPKPDAEVGFGTTFDRTTATAADLAHDLARRLATTATATSTGSDGSALGAAIRHHGDLHLGQVVLGPDGWVILDFEGEPARPLAERRRRHSPLRDVAGLLRSLAYAVEAHRRADGPPLAGGWEAAARAAVLDGYLATVRPDLLPATSAATVALLRLFELEKAVYEIGYELAHRPDWVGVPVAGLRRLLDHPAAPHPDPTPDAEADR